MLFSPELLASHPANEIVEIIDGKILAHVLKPACQVAAHAFLSAFGALGRMIGSAHNTFSCCSNHVIWIGHLASRGRGGVADAPWQLGSRDRGCAGSPAWRLTALL